MIGALSMQFQRLAAIGTAVALIFSCPGVVAAEEHAGAEPAPPFTVPLGQRQLFLDEYGIAQVEHLTRTMHQPVKKGAVIRPSYPEETSVQTRSAPAWDPTEKVFKLWLLSSRPTHGSQPLWTFPTPEGSNVVGMSLSKCHSDPSLYFQIPGGCSRDA